VAPGHRERWLSKKTQSTQEYAPTISRFANVIIVAGVDRGHTCEGVLMGLDRNAGREVLEGFIDGLVLGMSYRIDQL
jgi:hypothetical protein